MGSVHFPKRNIGVVFKKQQVFYKSFLLNSSYFGIIFNQSAYIIPIRFNAFRVITLKEAGKNHHYSRKSRWDGA